MPNKFDYGAGGVLSADIAVNEHEKELAFYSSILTTGASPLWREDLMNNRGMPIIGLGVRKPEYDILPLQWMPHFQVADIAASAEAAVRLGGKELMHGKSEEGESQWAVLVDPDGAGFGLIPVVAEEDHAVDSNGEVGCIAGLSIMVPDASTSRNYYQEVIGYSSEARSTQAGENAVFEMFSDNQLPAAEIRQCDNGADAFPAVWLLHLPVDDLDESLRRVSEKGGHVVKEYKDAQRAVIRDPIGVHFALQGG